ncbi:PHP domain-containing protein [Candidatus Margulisiibacteriota bacterium]
MKLVADLHTHTVSSGHAYSTLEEYVEQAKKIGLEAIAITDHGPAMPGAPHYYHFSNMRMIPEKINGIRVYRGIEANIINNDGEVDFAGDYFTTLDIVMAAIHIRCGYEEQGKQKNTEVVLKAIEKNPRINIIAHPGNPQHPLNVEKVVAAAKEKGVLIELNNSSETSRKGSWDRCLAFAKEVKRQDWLVSVGSDAHFSAMLGGFDWSLKLIKAAGLSEKHVVNTSLEKIDKYLLKK